MKEFHIFRIQSYREILSIVSSFANDLFDQAHNNGEFLTQLSEKYSQSADFYVAEIGDGVARLA